MLKSVDDYIKANLIHSIHTTERRSFRGCRRRWNWVFREYYYPTTTAKPLEFGVAFHKAMETLYSPYTWSDLETAASLAQVVFKQTVEEQKQAFVKQNGGVIDPLADEDYQERVKLGLGMLRHYTDSVTVKDKHFTPVKVEVKFEVPITNPDDPNPETAQLWCKCDSCWKRYAAWHEPKDAVARGFYRWDAPAPVARGYWKGLPVTYGGRLDMLAKDRFNEYWIFDWKTAAQLTKTGDDDYLLLDDQITSYCWALWILGLPVAGFVYAEIKKAFPEEPEPLQRARLGRMYSVSKNGNYEYNTYKRTVMENDAVAYEEGLYDDFLSWLEIEGGKFNERHQISRSVEELRSAGRNIYYEACEIVDPELRIYPSPGRFSCNFCAFQEPCLGKNRGEDYQYTLATMFDKRRYHYYEDKQPSTDGKGGE